MATVTGQYAINFAALGNANPYTNADFVELEPSTARIDSGVWRCIDGSTDARWQLDPATYVPGATLRAKMELALTAGASDGIGIGLLDTSGNGYRIRVMSWGIALNRLDAWEPYTFSGIEHIVTNAQGDTFDIQYVKGTGAITIYKNGVQIPELNLTDTTYAANTLAPVLLQMPGDAGQGGFISFAADGVSAGGGSVNTQTLTDTVATTDQTFRSMLRGVVLTDSLVLQDFLSWWWYRTRTLSDSVVVTEGQTQTFTQYNAQMTDELTVADQLVWWMRRNRLLQDGVAITDELITSTIGYLIFTSILTSNVTVTDESLKTANFHRLMESNVLTADQILRALLLARDLLDAVEVTDSGLTAMQRFILLTDSVSLEDSLTASYIPDTGPIVDNPIIRIGFDQPEIAVGGYGLN